MRAVPASVRRQLARVPGLRPAARRLELTAARLAAAARAVPFRDLPPVDVVRLAYNVVLDREPDAAANDPLVEGLTNGNLTPREVIDRLRTSDEYRARTPVGPASTLQSLHLSRCEFIIGLPPAERLIDLGGSHTANPWGALVLMGYPYEFEDLVIVDLPPDDRHALYRSDRWSSVDTPNGPVRYEYRSMTDLSFADDASAGLVYSGQSIEHVTRDDARKVVQEVHRVLRPGGHFALDTPNAAVCRIQTADHIDPGHEHEYTLGELVDLLQEAGFEVVERKGLNLARRSVRTGEFDAAEVAANPGVFADAASCYLLALVARKGEDPPAR